MRKLRIWGLTILSLAMFAACEPSGGGPGGNGGTGGTGGEGGSSVNAPQRQWERTVIQDMYANSPSIAVSAKGTVDVVYIGHAGSNSNSGIVWTNPGGTPELIAEETAFTISPPHVARDANDNVHVVWGTAEGAGDAAKYAVRKGGTWTVEIIGADRYHPDIALASDGTPHVAFVDRETGNASAYHGVRGANGWQIEKVNPTDWFQKENEVGIVMTKDDLPIIAAVDITRMGIWVADAKAGGGWNVERVAMEQIPAGPLDLDIGPTGIVVGFKGETHAISAFRQDGTTNWLVELAAHHDSSTSRIGAAMGPTSPWIISDVDVDYPNGSAFLERSMGAWRGQLLASRGTNCGAQAIARDNMGEPLVAYACFDSVYLMRPIALYPNDWKSRCDQAAAEFCAAACKCPVSNEECCWGLNGSSTCTSSFGCPYNAPATLCGDPTIGPDQLQACRDELSSLTCVASSPLDLSGGSGACGKLYDPFQ